MDEIRLLLSDKLLLWALAIAPADHPETEELASSLHWLFAKKLRRFTR
ncbi:hypothetical protein [Pararhodobacter marinus]|nr:hypothetical protein [Pararhodobacter marinus]